MGIVAVGDNVVDCYLDSGHLYPGGNCVNVSVAVRRAGLASAYVGAIGTDMAGDVVHTALMDEGIELTRVRRVDGPNAYACDTSTRTGTSVLGDRRSNLHTGRRRLRVHRN
jgi:sugar/nucleoside kinase (ribokinase family)